MENLIGYLMSAMIAWMAPAGPVPAAQEEWLRPIAVDIAEVSLDPSQAPAFDGKDARPKTALLVAGVAWFESGYAPWVDDGRCNREAWRETHPNLRKSCDGGRSWSMWQIQPRAGEPTGTELVADRKLAIRVAIARMRASLAAHRGLCAYTGERVDCQKAKERMEKPLAWWRGHPLDG